MENEQPTNPSGTTPVPPPAPLTPGPATTSAAPTPKPLGLNPLYTETSSSIPVTPVVPPAPPATEPAPEPEPKHGGILKWIIIAVVIIGGAGTAAWLYFTGYFNPAVQLNGAATQEQTQSSSTENLTQTQDLSQTQDLGQTQTTAENQTTQQQSTNQTQIALNECPLGEISDPATSSCVCDINNNYFPLVLAGAYAQPSAGSQPLACTTCVALSNQIIQLGQSTDPADAARKDALQSLSTQNNCSPCSLYDDKISASYQSKTWDQYFENIVQKSNDATCGRPISTCDSLKWQLIFLSGLRDKAGKDTQTSPEMMLALKQKQQSLEEDLGNKTACYSMQNLCSDLKEAYIPTTQQVVINATPIIAAPIFGQTTLIPQPQTQEDLSQQNTEQASGTTVIPDLASVTAPQLFDKDFYLLHCPVENLQTQQSTTSVQQNAVPGKVARVKRTPSTQQTPSVTAPTP